MVDLSSIEYLTKKLKLFGINNYDIFNKAILLEIYNSNCIEGNTLTIQEIRSLFNLKLDSSDNKAHEELEVISYKEALEYIYKQNKFNLSIKEIIYLHYTLLNKTKPEEAGIMRMGEQDEVFILNSDTKLLPGNEVEEFLERIIMDYKQDLLNVDPLIAIARFKRDYIKCHPFFDGNGRTSRLIMNYLLLSNNYYPFIIKAKDRSEYFKALHDSINDDDIDIFVEWFITNYEENLKWLINQCKTAAYIDIDQVCQF